MAIAEIEGLKAIPYQAWLIKCYTNDYIYVGDKKGLQEAISRVRREPKNAGSRIRYQKIVG